jgi:hypothetical protein
MRKLCIVLGVLCIGAPLLGACTAEQMYYSTQHWQRNECRKVRSGDDRNRCESRPQLSFEQYEAERNKPTSKE